MFATTSNSAQTSRRADARDRGVYQLIQDDPSIEAIGLATPQARYSQEEICQSLGIEDTKLKKFFLHKHIQHRHLYFEEKNTASSILNEDFASKNQRFVTGALDIGQKAVLSCLHHANVTVKDIDFLCCVTSTGFIVPSLSALIIKKLAMREDCQRIDIVGMGCSAGLNGLQTVVNWAKTHPNQHALLICVEICSAIYTQEQSVRTAVVNSLFGDGAAAALVRSKHDRQASYHPMKHVYPSETEQRTPRILGFESHLIPAHNQELRFDWDEKYNAYSFFVGKQTPRVMASAIDVPLKKLLSQFELSKQEISYWILHGGGAAVVEGIKHKLNLTDEDIKYTRAVLHEYGNLSSGSFLFSYAKLIAEKKIRRGSYAIMITLGPGLAIEMALIKW